MAVIARSQLYYRDYSWTTYSGDNPKITGEPDSTLLNRKEGYEVLYFINKFCDINSLKNLSSATKVERMIREEIPSNIHSQQKIKTWITNNWKNSKF